MVNNTQMTNMRSGSGGYDKGSGGAEYNTSELLGVYRNLSYDECRDIYRYWSLGRRFAASLPNFAMSAKRKFVIKDAPPEVIEQLEKTDKELLIDQKITETLIHARVYGISGLYLADEENGTEPLTYKTIQNKQISFNPLDPLALGFQLNVDTNPLSVNYNKPLSAIVQGQNVSATRLCHIQNDIPQYLKFTESSNSFSGTSIYQNMTLLMRAWNKGVISFQRIATKAGSIIKVSREVAHGSNISLQGTKMSLQMIRDMENDGIANIQEGESIEFFSLAGVGEVDSIIKAINDALLLALTDTPAGILLDKNLSFGLNDGSEDMKSIIMAIERFRLKMIAPLYEFTDKFLLYKAFSPAFIEKVKQENPDLYPQHMSNQDILRLWEQNYSYEWGELYPATPTEEEAIKQAKLGNIQTLDGLGVEKEIIESLLNKDKIFIEEIKLNKSNDGGLDKEIFGISEQDNNDSQKQDEKEKENESKDNGNGDNKENKLKKLPINDNLKVPKL